jgi:RHS repeat-associated protein
VADTRLLATDQQRSVLYVLDVSRPHPIAYSPYGHHPAESGLLSLLGFNGERPDPVTGCYLLGNGYRAFNPVLMRFNSPDSWSPFGEGGLNAYGYCVGDPVNRIDPTGHIGNPFKGLLNLLGRTPRSVRATRAFEAATAFPINSAARTEPPPHSQGSTNRPDSAPPGYFDNSNAEPVHRAFSEQSLESPPPYPGAIPPPMDPFERAGLQKELDLTTAHLQRVVDATQHLESSSPVIQQTIASLTRDIHTYRDRLDLPPLYISNRDLRESL